MKEGDRISESELQILLNILGSRLTISYPLYGFDLLAAHVDGIGYRFSIACTPEQLDQASAEFGDLAYEVPGYDDLRTCLINAGIVTFTNWGEFFHTSQARHLVKSDIVFALDTNLLYDGFPKNAGIEPSHLLLIDTIKAEMEHASNLKYTPAQISALKRDAPFQHQMLDELTNQRPKKARRAAYLALKQFKLIRDRAIEWPGIEPSSQDKEQNDLIIVKSVRQYQGAKSSRPILLTADRNVATLAEIEGIGSFYFELPLTIGEHQCSPSQLVSFLFNLATVFGFIKLNSVHIYGEYRGKGSSLDELKLVFLSKQLEETFAKDVSICRKLIALDIPR